MGVVTNQQLFSHTYLSGLQTDPSNDESAAKVAHGLRDWLPFRDTSSLQSLIDSWIGPVLDFLGFQHQPAEDSTHIRLLYTYGNTETPVGLCYVISPNQDLDDTTKGRHPIAQAVLALRKHELRWGILTDGARWRLLDAQALRRYEHYLEVNLDELARSDDPTPLRLFYACFHRSALTPDEDGENGLDHLVKASTEATEAAEDHLKARVSHNEGIMAQLCLGLVRADGRTRYAGDERDAIYRDATYLLYRILFVLYAEARGLLPVDNPAYQPVSLGELVQTARDYKLRGMSDPQATTLWQRLKRLCNAIYESDEALGIPAYNGGLFDDADKPHLHNSYIADVYLSQALFDLAYMPDTRASNGFQPIDYRDLSVRHLGSLYEGMIEYKLQIAEEALWARRDKKGNLRFLHAGEDGAPRKTDEKIAQGSVYFSQSPGERRATGTYYTPEYIVDYIVRQTVWKGLEERRAPLEEKLACWRKEIAAASPAERARMQHTADEEVLRFVEEQVLTFRVCDPAMGSGHFLVNTAHQMTAFIIETLYLTPWENPAIETNPVAWRRRVVERCLYGVDISLMAVELAKLSLWLASVAERKPLSFLDHHLRRGNSLIGARLEDLAEIFVEEEPSPISRREQKERAAGQLSMFDDPAFSQHVTAATDLLTQISAGVAESIEDVKAQAAEYERVRAELEPYRRLADIWTASHFGLEADEKQLRTISKYLMNGAVSPVPEYQHLLTEARELANEQHIFHWELEFPKAFFDRHDRKLADKSGFDVVVGNPPYGHIGGSLSTAFTRHRYRASSGRTDVYLLFYEIGFSIVTKGGRLAYITPNSWFTRSYEQDLRTYILSELTLESLREYAKGVFSAAPDIVPAIPVVSLSRPATAHEVQVEALVHKPLQEWQKDDVWPVQHTICQGVWLRNPNSVINPTLQSPALISKLLERSVPFGSITDSSACIGVYGYSEKARRGEYTSSVRHSGEWKPALRGRSLYRYGLEYEGEYVHYGEWLFRPREEKYFNQAKLLWQLIRKTSMPRRLVATVDPAGIYYPIANINSAIPTSRHSLGYLLSLFNSRTLNYWYARTYHRVDINLETIRTLPTRRIEFTTPLAERDHLTAQARILYCNGLKTANWEPLINFVAKQLQLDYTPDLGLVEAHNTEPVNRSDPILPGQLVERSDVVHDLLAYLAEQMIDFNKERHRLEQESDPFGFVDRDIPCLRLEKALSGPLSAGEIVREHADLPVTHHDIDGLRLTQEDKERWLLAIRAKLRDPASGWREYQRDKKGNLIRQWLPAYRLHLDEEVGRFYHYVFRHLDGFYGAKIPGGYTRTTLEKLLATKVPKLVPVDLTPLVKLEAELAEVQRKIQLTDDLIDQIVYRLYGLTEEEIAIVEGRA